MQRQSSLTFVGVDSGTPINEKLCGRYLQTFAYATVKDRLPVILTKIVDHLSRDKDEIIKKFGPDAENCIKEAIGKLSKLKNEVQTNKPLVRIESTADDVADWNGLLEELEKTGPECWFHSTWLYSENYLYRRIREIFETSKSLKNFDPFQKQKEEAFEAAVSQLRLVADSLTSNDSIEEKFIKSLKLSLWSNRCDLSLSNGVVEDQEDSGLGNVKALDQFLLADDSKKAFQVVSQHSSKIIDIIHDNAAYELFADLCMADQFIQTGLANTVRLRVKKFPWYVSDATLNDVEWLLQRLPSEGMENIVKRWREYIETGRWKIIENKFWTLPFAYSELKSRDPELYESLSEASLIIFKGDLNYRKLVGDINWSFSEPFPKALQGFNPTNVLALRTIKADVVCGLPAGITEAIFQKEPMWMRTGEYGVIQLSQVG